MKGAHDDECALRYASLGAPSKTGRYDAELLCQLKEAWAEKGIDDIPSYFPQGPNGSGYYFPDEIA